MKNRFNLNEEEKKHIRGLHGINLINENSKHAKIDMVTCAEQSYDIPGLVINMAGSIADNMLRSDALEGKDESEMYGFWMAAFMNNLLIDKGTDSKLVEDIKNSTGCMYEILKKHDMLDIVMNESINEDAGMDTPGGNPDYFYDEDSLFAKEKGFPDNLENILNNLSQQDGVEMSKEDIVNELIGIYSYSQDGATDLVNTALETLITNLGGFKDDINEQETKADMDVTLENLLGEAQRLTRFVENRRMGKDNWSNEDLVNIQENINKEITNYLK